MKPTDSARSKYIALVGIDLSESSELAITQALELARGHEQAEIHVVHAIPGMPPMAAMSSAPDLIAATTTAPPVPDRLTLDLARDIRARLEQAIPREHERRDGLRWLIHVSILDPVHAIVQIATDVEADVIVIGTHSRTGLARFLFGSVAESVVRIAPCPVFVVRPTGARSAVESPQIEPACPQCLEIRRESNGARFWCDHHRAHHNRAHTYRLAPFHDSHQSGLLLHPLD